LRSSMQYLPGMRKKATIREFVVILLKNFNIALSLQSLVELIRDENDDLLAEGNINDSLNYGHFFRAFSKSAFRNWRKRGGRDAPKKRRAKETIPVSPNTMKRTVRMAFDVGDAVECDESGAEEASKSAKTLGLDSQLQMHDKKRVEITKAREKQRVAKYKRASAHFVADAGKMFDVAGARKVLASEMGRHFKTVHEAFLAFDANHKTSTLSVSDFRKALRNRFNLEMRDANFVALLVRLKLMPTGGLDKGISYDAFRRAFGDMIDGGMTGGGISVEMQARDAAARRSFRDRERARIAKYKRPSAHFVCDLMTAEEARERLLEAMGSHFRSLHEAYLAMAVDRTKKFLTSKLFRSEVRNRFNIELSDAEFKRFLRNENLVELGTNIIRYRAFRNAFAASVDGHEAGDLLRYGAEQNAKHDRMLRKALKIAKSPVDLKTVRLNIERRQKTGRGHNRASPKGRSCLRMSMRGVSKSLLRRSPKK